MRHLTAEDIARSLPVADAADALEAALAGGLDPERQAPRSVVELGAGQLLVMPAAVGAHAAVKLVTVGGSPRVQGVCVVFDAATLAPVALLDGIALTNVRTAAVAALAVRRLAAPDARRLLVFGRGPQARAHVSAMRAVRPIERVDVVGRGDRVSAAVLAGADVICCCTTAREPLFDGARVSGRATVVAIGSHEPDVRETDDALAARATVVVESRASALREAGDVIGAIAAGVLDPQALVTLRELVTGSATVPGDRPRLFKSTGMAWEDAVVAGAVVERSIRPAPPPPAAPRRGARSLRGIPTGTVATESKEQAMGEGSKDNLKGDVKELGGDLTGDESLKREGKVDKATGSVKDAVGGAADKAKDLVNPDRKP